MKAKLITSWKEWERLSERYNFNPSEVTEFSIDEGKGNPTDFEYIGDIPRRQI